MSSSKLSRFGLMLTYSIGIVATLAMIGLIMQSLVVNNTLLVSDDSGTPIMKVGKETIYQSDYDYELAYLPAVPGVDTHQIIMDKLVRDSMILQEGESLGYIELDKTAFNASTKISHHRMTLVQQVENEYRNETDMLGGTIVSVWFGYDYPNAPSYDDRKNIVTDAITNIHTRLGNGEITIEQVIEELKNNEQLRVIDPIINENVSVSFVAYPNEAITFDSSFDEVIRGLDLYGISDIYTAKDIVSEDGDLKDAAIMFAQVDTIEKNGNALTFEDWLDSISNNYNVKEL